MMSFVKGYFFLLLQLFPWWLVSNLIEKVINYKRLEHENHPLISAYIPEVPINGFLSKNKFEYKTSEDYEKLPQSFARAMSTPSKLGK